MTNYGTIYTLPFNSIKGVDYIVEIQKESYTGSSTELTGSGDAPFSIELSDEDFLYTPSRLSTATIRVIGGDYLQALYSTGYQQHRVNFKQGNRVVWTGFVTPELYTQDYTSTLFDLEIQCVSAMSVLEYVKYQEIGGNRTFVSLWDLLKKCASESRGSYSSVYVPHVYAASESSYNTSANILQGMTVSEQDFFDEDDEAMMLREVLEEICKLLSWTCVDYRGELFFVDADHRGIYRKYSADLSTFETVTPGALKVQDIGFFGADHSLDILGGYNKAVVKVSNYSFKQVFPEEDYDKLKEFSGKIETSLKGKVSVKQFLYPEAYKLYQYGYGIGLGSPWHVLNAYELELYKNSPTLTPNDIVGAMPVKRCEYKVVNGKPDITNYTWEELIRVLAHKDADNRIIDSLVLELANSIPPAPYSDGAIVIGMSIQVNMSTPLGDLKQSGWLKMNCVLSIGDNYYNGKEWVKDSAAGFEIEFMLKDHNGSSFVRNVNTKTLSMPYDGAEGYVIELPRDRILIGAVNFRMYQLSENHNHDIWHVPEEVHYTGQPGNEYFIKDLKMNYTPRNGVADDIENNSDRYYENIVNESYVNPADEIEFKISSYNNDGACYSKVMLGDNYLTDNLYSAIENKPIRPEEGLIRRIVNQYSATKIKLTQVLKYSDSITPITSIADKFQSDKRFIVTGGEIDFANDSFTVKMVQNGN